MATTTSTHYIRTIHTSFTAAHSAAAAASNPWARSSTAAAAANSMSSPLYSNNTNTLHQKYPTQPAVVGAAAPAQNVGGRRRAYAFRVAPQPQQHSPPAALRSNNKTGAGYKFDPFADEPTSPVPSLAHLASLSTPPTPRLAAASLPPSQHSYQLQQQAQRSGTYQQGGFHTPPPVRRQLGGGFHAGVQRRTGYQPPQQYHYQQQQKARGGYMDNNANVNVWGTGYGAASSSPIPRGRTLTYEFEEYTDSPSSDNYSASGLQRIAPPRIQRAAPLPAPAAARAPTPLRAQPAPLPSPTPASRAAPRTPSPPTPAPVPTRSYAADKDAKAKLVAGILLNRAATMGRKGRRVPSPPVGGKGRVYVPSGLREVVACEA